MKHLSKEVSFKINQLLYDKGWRYELGVDETGHKVKNSLAEQRWNEGDLTYVDITIAEVIDWLYEKHGIWIMVKPYNDKELSQTLWENNIIDISDDYNDYSDYTFYHLPAEAYEAAIKYTLNNPI